MKAPRKLGTQNGEDAETSYLPGDTSDHDVDSHLCARFGIGGRGDGAANGLQQQRDEVECDEGDSVGTRCETRNVFTICDDDAGEAEVD